MKLSKQLKKEDGLIAIVALIIFALMMVVGISLQMTVMDTYQSVKASDNYMSARVTADSIMELLEFKLKDSDVGLNSGEIICGYGNYAPAQGETNPAFCDNFQFLTTLDPLKAQQDIKITIKAKGRNEENEKIKTAKCGNLSIGVNECYVVPFPGTGDAGDEEYCKVYKPDFAGENGADTKVPANLANGNQNLDQLNYSCNWGKLRFGSAMTDRVAIPLYYDEAELGEESGIVNVFNDETPDDFKASNILVRVRTPCVPDASKKNETVCSDNERYVLDDGGDITSKKNDIVVQWLINGECATDPNGKLEFCGVIPIGDKTKDEDIISAFYESKIKEVNNTIYNYILIDNNTITYDTNEYPDLVALLSSNKHPIKLPLMSKPILTMFLSHPLWTEDKDNIPYLEYQVLTDKPVSNNKRVLEVNVVVNTNGFTRTITQDVPMPLIDFAIQNN